MPNRLDFAHPAARRAWIRHLLAPMDEAKWNHLSLEFFAHQVERVPAYARLSRAGITLPPPLAPWKGIPAVPQALFKRTDLYGAGLPKPAAVYETSGTTTGQPGRQHLSSTDIYRAVSVEGARRIGLFANVGFLHFLVPSPADAPHSSLSAMFGFWQRELGMKRGKFWVHENAIDFGKLRETLAAQIKARVPVGIAGTAFSFVHLIDAWAGRAPLKLPRGSWLLETGGFKGRSREVSKPELYKQLARAFGVRDDDIHNEYGMSELASQAYARGTSGLHETPPWARVLVVNPATGREVAVGQKGLVRWIDLANVDSVLALQTLDVAERTARGFRLIGRLPRTEPRGCSLSAEDLVVKNVRQFASVDSRRCPSDGLVDDRIGNRRDINGKLPLAHHGRGSRSIFAVATSPSPPLGQRRLPAETLRGQKSDFRGSPRPPGAGRGWVRNPGLTIATSPSPSPGGRRLPTEPGARSPKSPA